MQTFAELLTEYMDRTGIGDAELARRIPVSRPTLVRWKEGVTTRPRYREDVVRCAELLRLTEEETDELLLAAGFAPESVPAEVKPTPAVAIEDEQPSDPDAGEELSRLLEGVGQAHERAPGTVPRAVTRSFVRRRPGLLIAGAIVTLTVVIAVGAVVGTRARDSTVYPVAADGESLIVLAPFVNYTAGGQGFNVAGRLRSAIDGEVREAGLGSVRTVEWPAAIEEEVDAESAGKRADATLVIWGEYDSGRVMARFTIPNSRPSARAQQVVDIASSPAELPTIINIGLAEEVRYIALMTLGQLYLDESEFDLAKTVLIRALDAPPAEPAALANLRFLLGRAYLGGDLVDFDEAIWLFTQVLAIDSRSVETLNSRALAYMDRGRRGDVDLALDDLNRAITIRPERAATHLNLGVAYMERGADGDADRALRVLNEALSAQPEYTSALVNRAGAYILRGVEGDLESALEDIDTVLEIDPGLPAAYVVRGNALVARGEAGDLELAIREYSKAVELDPKSPVAHFNRGLAHSELLDWSASLADLRRAQELSPLELEYNRTLCWQSGVAGDPAGGLQFCELAVAYDYGGQSQDGRGLVNALLGRNEDAIADFEAFLEWVAGSPKESCRDYYRPSRQSWVEWLKVGESPFDHASLVELRIRPAVPGFRPC